MSAVYFIVFGIILILGLIKLYVLNLTKWCRSKVCLVGKTAIVTGANTGIGYETALDLAKRGARVILACRDEKRGSRAVETIQRVTENKNVVLKLLDLSSLKSVSNFAKDIIETEKQVDILINNAAACGVGSKITEDGLQLIWSVNYFGPVLLTFLLLDVMKKSAPSRIINVSSVVAKASNLNLNNLASFNDFNNHAQTYCNTKLCNILFTQELAQKLQKENISVFSLHPGNSATEIFTRRLPGALKIFGDIVLRLFFLSPEEAAQTTIYTACEQGIEHLSGSHFEFCQVIKPYKTAKDPALVKKVWDKTLNSSNIMKYYECK